MNQNWWKGTLVLLLILVVGWVIANKGKSNLNNDTAANNTPFVSEQVQTPSTTEAKPVQNQVPGVPATITPTEEKKPTDEQKPADKPQAEVKKQLPKMIELGADSCVPCKMMKPVMEELKTEYKDKMEVVFYDVWKDPSIAEKYKIQSIPTQVFLDENGIEFFRHTGFFSKEEIVAVFAKQGYNFK